MANYFIYPLKNMRITQTYNGSTSHRPHNTGTPKDYPLDDGGASSDTRDGVYCPCDEMVVKRVYGVGSRGVNTVWLESTSKVDFADGTSDYVTIMFTHPNDSDLKGVTVGKKYKRKELITKEGTDGGFGIHIHISAGKGKFKGNGWTPNSNKKYVLTTTNGTYKPEALFYIDKSFTKILSAAGLTFKTMPVATSKPKQSPAPKKETKKENFLPERGYFQKGDKGEKIEKLSSFMRKTFPTYVPTSATGPVFGPNLEKAVKEFQRRMHMGQDGLVGPKTLKALKDFGFKE